MSIILNSVFDETLNSPHITDICFNRYNEVFIDQGNGLERWNDACSIFNNEIDYRNFILEHLSKSGKTWDAKLPFVDTIFFNTHRAHIAFPPLAQFGIYLSLRRLPSRTLMPMDEAQQAARRRWEHSPHFPLLIEAMKKHETLLLAGSTGCGKTTLLNDLLSFADERERMIALEDTAEISPKHPHFLSLLSRSANSDGIGAVIMRDLLKQTLRMRPDRILLGECRGDEVLDLLQCLNTGHRGTLCTIHANSARDALKRVELLALIGARGTIPSNLIRELMVNGIQKVVYLERTGGVRKIHSVIQIAGKEGETILCRPL